MTASRSDTPTPTEPSSAEALRAVRELEESLIRRRTEIQSSRTVVAEAEAGAAQILADARQEAHAAAAAVRTIIIEDADETAARLLSEAEGGAQRLRTLARQRRAADVAALIERVLETSTPASSPGATS